MSPDSENKMPNKRKRGSKTHGDITGRQAAKQQAELAQEKKREALTTATAAQQEREQQEEVVNLVRKSPEPEPAPEVEYQDGSAREDEEPDATIEALAAEAEQPASREVGGIVRQQNGDPTIVQPETKVIRALYDLPQVTVGAGNHYDFEEGRKYEVPLNVAQHLEQKELADIL